ncbi:MAG: hypothetical protein AB7O67_14925 [Vicinamibacterales bacterium]
MTPQLVADVGSDHYLTRGEAAQPGGGRVSTEVWSAYQESFDGFTGSRLDPHFAALDTPIRFVGEPQVAPGTTIVIAGSEGDAARRAADLKHVRRHVSLWTSAEGAEALASRDVSADLMIGQHRTDVGNALHVRHVTDRDGSNILGTAPLVMADYRLPAMLLAGVPDARLIGVEAARGWGWWPATLVSLALRAGASAVVLTGVDLDRPARRPLRAVLSLLASASAIPLVASDTAQPPGGWVAARLRDTPGPAGQPAVQVARTVGATRDRRLATLATHLSTLTDVVRSVEAFRAAALEARGRRYSRAGDATLEDAWLQMHAWGRQRETRIAIQDGLGARLLPRAWRDGARNVAGPLWRPVLMVTDELARQAQRASTRLEARQEKRSA